MIEPFGSPTKYVTDALNLEDVIDLRPGSIIRCSTLYDIHPEESFENIAGWISDAA